MLAIAIIILILGLVVFGVSLRDKLMTKTSSELFVLSLAVIALSIFQFYFAFDKSNKESVLNTLVIEKKIVLKMNETTKDVEYVLLDSTLTKLFKELQDK